MAHWTKPGGPSASQKKKREQQQSASIRGGCIGAYGVTTLIPSMELMSLGDYSAPRTRAEQKTLRTSSNPKAPGEYTEYSKQPSQRDVIEAKVDIERPVLGGYGSREYLEQFIVLYV